MSILKTLPHPESKFPVAKATGTPVRRLSDRESWELIATDEQYHRDWHRILDGMFQELPDTPRKRAQEQSHNCSIKMTAKTDTTDIYDGYINGDTSLKIFVVWNRGEIIVKENDRHFLSCAIPAPRPRNMQAWLQGRIATEMKRSRRRYA